MSALKITVTEECNFDRYCIIDTSKWYCH